MYQISKQFHFSAAHRLAWLPPAHKCHNLHGHDYHVEVVLESEELDAFGFVVDYGDLAPIKEFIDSEWDHQYLNDVIPELDGQTTAENLARVLYERLKGTYPQLAAVRVSETPKTWAEYRPEQSK